MSEIAIRTENLSRDFGPIKAVDGLSMEVPSGIIFGFLVEEVRKGKASLEEVFLTLMEEKR